MTPFRLPGPTTSGVPDRMRASLLHGRNGSFRNAAIKPHQMMNYIESFSCSKSKRKEKRLHGTYRSCSQTPPETVSFRMDSVVIYPAPFGQPFPADKAQRNIGSKSLIYIHVLIEIKCIYIYIDHPYESAGCPTVPQLPVGFWYPGA